MGGLEAARNRRAVVLHVLDGVEFLDVRDDGGNFPLAVAQAAKGVRHAAIDDFQHAAARQQFIFDQGDVRLDAGGVAVHEEGDGAGGGQDGDLGVAIAGFLAAFQGAVPAVARLVLEIGKFLAGMNVFDGVAM